MKTRLPWLLFLSLLLAGNPLHAAVQRAKFTAGSQYLVVETLDDDLSTSSFPPWGPDPMPRRR